MCPAPVTSPACDEHLWPPLSSWASGSCGLRHWWCVHVTHLSRRAHNRGVGGLILLMKKEEELAAGWASPRAVLLVRPGFPEDPWASPGPLDRSHWVESGEQYLTCPPGLYSQECEEWGPAESSGEGAEARSRPRPQGRAQTGPWASCLPVVKRATLVGTGLQTALPNFVGTLRKKLLASEGRRAPVSVARPSPARGGVGAATQVITAARHLPPHTFGLADSPLSLSSVQPTSVCTCSVPTWAGSRTQHSSHLE